MHPLLAEDSAQLNAILQQVLEIASRFLNDLPERPPGVAKVTPDISELPEAGLGAAKTLERFQEKYMPRLTGSAGARYWGFVTGGTTPAALAGDWLVSAFDQNPTGDTEPATVEIEHEALQMLRRLFGLLDEHSGTFVSGATMANFVGLAVGRQWIAQQLKVNLGQDGMYGLPPIRVLSGAAHSSIYKALSMLGMGRQRLQVLPLSEGREAVDITALRGALIEQNGQPCIVVANAGTVNTVDFDDLAAIVELRSEFNFWLHVDAAFGGFAVCSPLYSSLLKGLEAADSITIDAHKWLNVPYDSAMQFTRHRGLQVEVFQNSAVYLGAIGANPGFVHLTPENSRRWRALPAWFTLMAYGAEGYREIVERDCAAAQQLGAKIAASDTFELLAPVRLNVVCFTLKTEAQSHSLEEIKSYLDAVRDAGKVFMTPTVYQGIPAIRAAFSNWRTEAEDVEIAWESMLAVAKQSERKRL